MGWLGTPPSVLWRLWLLALTRHIACPCWTSVTPPYFPFLTELWFDSWIIIWWTLNRALSPYHSRKITCILCRGNGRLRVAFCSIPGAGLDWSWLPTLAGLHQSTPASVVSICRFPSLSFCLPVDSCYRWILLHSFKSPRNWFVWF